MNKPNLLLVVLFFAVCETSYADDLLTIYHQALEADPELKASETKIKIGSAQKGQALGEMLPQITGTGNWSTNRQESGNLGDDYTGTRYVVSLNQTLIDFPKFWNWRRAKSVESQYALENIEAQQTLLFNVVERYFAVLEAEDELKFFTSEQETTAQQKQQIEKLSVHQLVKITDVYAIEARLDQIKASMIEAEAKVVTAKDGLKELTNKPPESLVKLRDEIYYKELEGKLEDWLEVAKSENPSLAAQQYAITAADEEVALQRSKHLPVVELQLNYFNTDTGFQSSRTNQTETRVAAINVNVPLFSGGTTTRRTEEAQHKLTLNKYASDAKLRALIKETSDAFLSSNANVRRIKATRKALESANKSREAMETGFKYGVVTMNDVLNAQQEEFQVKRDLSQAKYGYIKNRIRFMQAIGLISEDNLVEVNNWLETNPSQDDGKQ
ncbi:MAG: TolC family outer membrane protein [Methylococcaceae bacterium]|nr:TolC family outer membrane protein [Methylococcaceae bacterium]